MSLTSAELLVEQRVAQLEAISIRRNELLRQMYHMMRNRSNVGTVFALDEVDDRNLQLFLQRFDICKDPNTGSITNLNETELLSENHSQPLASSLTPSPTLDMTMRRATRSQSRVAGPTKSPSPSPSKQSVVPLPLGISRLESPVSQEVAKDMDVDRDQDETDLIASPSSDDEGKERNVIEKTLGLPPKDVVMDENPSTPPLPPMEARTEGVENAAIEAGQEEEAISVAKMTLGEPTASNAETAAPIQPVATETVPPNVPEKSVNATIEDNDVDMEDVEDGLEDGSEEEVSRTVDRPSLPPVHSTTLSPSNEPIKSSIPFMHLGPSSPIPATPTPRPPIIILAPDHPSANTLTFNFDENLFASSDQSKTPNSSFTQRHQYSPNYTLPPIKVLPQEFNRKVKTKSRRKEKEREREKEGSRESSKRDDWFPMGINKWAATLNANPIWKRVSRPTKCLSSREWAVAITELKLIRTFDRIESLKDGGRWSFRQPKKQRGVGGLTKTHWDYLMDEMKWMRIDFREERRWKLALGHTLAAAVMEWHAAGSLEERVLRGICVLWSPAHTMVEGKHDDDIQDNEQKQHETAVSHESEPADHAANVLLGVDYGSDEEENDDQPDVVDALQPQTILEDALKVPLLEETHVDQEAPIKPKTEETDDTSALQFNPDSAQTDTQPANESVDQPIADPEEKDTKDGVIGLKSTSKDPILGTKASSNSSSNNGDSDTPATSTKSSLKQVYAPLRERLLKSEIDKLFLDLDDFHITQRSEAGDINLDLVELNLPPADLSAIFPELQPLSFLDVAPPAPVPEGKKKAEKRSDRDDPNKRTEDTTYTKLFPIGQFMYKKPTLIGPLQPSRNWKDGKWLPLDELPVYVEYEGQLRPPEDAMSEIFDNRLSNSTILAQQQLMFAAARERDKDRRRTTEHQWSVNDDTLLKSLIDRYPYNWQLISESFNATRVTTPTDKRTARDCFERWREKWAPEVRRHPEAPSQAAPAPVPEESPAASTSQMTTRGVKRLASSMATTSVAGASGGSEPKKRRRHILLQETIRRSVKKKAEFQQKMLTNQRKPSTIHETHGPFNNMRYYSPAELSRMKTEKDTKATQEIQLRRRQEEARATIRAGLTPAQQQSLVQQQQLQQQLLQQQQTTQQSQQSQQPGTPAQPQQQSQQTGQQPTPQPAAAQTQSATVAQPTAQQAPQPAQVANIAQRSQNTLLANQSLGNFRGQVNVSRINSPNVAAGARLTTQQILQLQQAQQQARPGSQPAQSSQAAVHQMGQQGQILVPSLNGNGTALNGAHLAASFVNRDSTSSPAHVSPPRKSATPTNVNSPRMATDQMQHGQVQMSLVPNTQVAGNAMARPTSTLNYYNIPGLTQEQFHAIRLQLMQQQQASTQQDSSGQAPTQNSFSS